MSPGGKTLLVLGGTSDIGRMTARSFAAAGWTIRLVGRDLDALQRERDDIAARSGVVVTNHRFDVLDTASFPSFLDALPELPDAVVCVIGLLGDQKDSEADLDRAAMVMRSNYEGPALILGLLAERFFTRGHGVIVGVSSVAGDRGRASNYIYGSAKAGLTAYLAGLRHRAAKTGVRVLTVKPGFVRTRMTEGMKLPGALTAEPGEVGDAILRGVERQKDVIYVRPAWRLIMLIIRAIPEPIFKKLSL